MSKVVWKPGTFVYPIPAVMVSCGTMEKSNIVTVAWTGIINSDPAMVYISVRQSRYSYQIIKEQGEFVINLTTKDLAKIMMEELRFEKKEITKIVILNNKNEIIKIKNIAIRRK